MELEDIVRRKKRKEEISMQSMKSRTHYKKERRGAKGAKKREIE